VKVQRSKKFDLLSGLVFTLAGMIGVLLYLEVAQALALN
jgi:hypothetical protein